MNYKTFILVFVFGLLPVLALAQGGPQVYKPLVEIPSLVTQDFGSYINALYGLSIAVAALMAVIKIIIAGVKYMLSDVVTSKQEAIGDIRGSLLGLGVVISAVLVLTVINPQLIKTDIFTDQLTAQAPNTNPTSAPSAPQNGRYQGYKFRAVHPDPGFRSNCENTPQAYYALQEGKEICYDPVPPAENANFANIFGANSSFYDVFEKEYQRFYRPRLIADGLRLSQIATAEGSKNGSANDVFLAVRYEDTSRANPPIPMDFIDAFNGENMTATCRRFQATLSTSNTPVRVAVKGNLTKGYLACVLMPN